MRVQDVLKLTAGSCVVYLVIGACSSYSSEDARKGATTPATPAADGATITSPVPNALAGGYQSGSRLKLRFYQGEDGSKEFIDFVDAQLKTECDTRRSASEDKWRCLPASTGTLYFSDAACTVPSLYGVAKSNPQPTIGVVTARTVGTADSYYQLGALANPSQFFGSGKDSSGGGQGACVAATVDATVNYYAVSTPLAPTAFVEMTIQNE